MGERTAGAEYVEARADEAKKQARNARGGLVLSALLIIGGLAANWDGLNASHQMEQAISEELLAAEDPDLANLTDVDVKKAQASQRSFYDNDRSLLADYYRGEARENPEDLLARIRYSTEVYGLEGAAGILRKMDKRNAAIEPIASKYNPEYFLRELESVLGMLSVFGGIIVGLYSWMMWNAARVGKRFWGA